jgi:hypothetical protein
MKPAKPLDLTRTAAALAAYDLAHAKAQAVILDAFAAELATLRVEEAQADLAHALADDIDDPTNRVELIAAVMRPAGPEGVRMAIATWRARRAAA